MVRVLDSNTPQNGGIALVSKPLTSFKKSMMRTNWLTTRRRVREPTISNTPIPSGKNGFGELEGIAHRSNFDLCQHQEHSKTKLEYFETETRERYLPPHVIEPASGLTRGLLVLLAEAYDVDESRPSPELMRFKPSMAPSRPRSSHSHVKMACPKKPRHTTQGPA